MNKIKLCVLILLVGVASLSAKTQSSMVSSEPERIILTGQSEQTPNRPRTPDMMQIEAWCYSSNNTIELLLCFAGAQVSVSIVKEGTEDIYNYVVPGTGSFFFPITSTGHWFLSITLENNEIYWGDFTI